MDTYLLCASSGPLAGAEYALGKTYVDADVRLVHQLSDRHIPGDTDQLIGHLTRELFFAHQEIDHFLDGGTGRDVEIRIGGHADVVGRSLGARPGELQVFAYGELQAAAQRSLNGGLIDLAITLGDVTVADLEQRATGEDRDIQGAAGHKLAIVEIAGMTPGRIAAEASGLGARRNTHAAEERPQWYHDAGSELRGHAPAVERDDAHRSARLAILRQYPLAAVVAIVDRQIDRLNL